MRTLLMLAAAVAGATFLVRLVSPFGTEQQVADLNFWEWPAAIALFGLGVVAYRRGWLTELPDRLRRRCGRVAAASVVAAFGFAAYAVAARVPEDQLIGGWHWAALGLAAAETMVTVFGSVWLLGAAQRRLDRQFRFGPVLARSSYGAFILQGPVLIALAVMLRPVPVPAEPKALLVAVSGVGRS